MTTLLPFVALALALLAAFATRRATDRKIWNPIAWRSLVGALVLLAVLTAAAWQLRGATDAVSTFEGVVLGMCAAFIALGLNGGPAASLALGVAAAAGAKWSVSTGSFLQDAVLIGASLAALAAWTEGDEAPGAICSLGALLATVADQLGAATSREEPYASAGVVLVLGAVLIGIAVILISQSLSTATFRKIAPVVAVLFAAWGAVCCTRYMHLEGGPVSLFMAVVVAFAVHKMLPPTNPSDPLRSGVAALLWLGLATVSFGLAKSLGMALALGLAAAMLCMLDNRRALLTLGPLVGLVLYRTFREAHPDISRALDIGQHYALVGLITGAVLPLLPSDWLRTGRSAAGATLWGVLLVGLPAVLSLVLGAKGAVGFVAGLGLALWIESFRAEASVLPVALSAGIAGLLFATYGWTASLGALSRDDKLKFFVWTSVVVAVVAMALAAIRYRAPKAEAV